MPARKAAFGTSPTTDLLFGEMTDGDDVVTTVEEARQHMLLIESAKGIIFPFYI